MSVFGSIMSKIFGHPAAAAGQPPAPSAPDASRSMPPTTATASSAQQGDGAPASAPQQQPIDVAAVLTDLAAKNPQELDWRRSVVDLMKLLDLDSSLAARKQLAQELRYGGDTGDSATMNVWLHRQVMRKLAENGGRVPDDLKS